MMSTMIREFDSDTTSNYNNDTAGDVSPDAIDRDIKVLSGLMGLMNYMTSVRPIDTLTPGQESIFEWRLIALEDQCNDASNLWDKITEREAIQSTELADMVDDTLRIAHDYLEYIGCGYFGIYENRTSKPRITYVNRNMDILGCLTSMINMLAMLRPIKLITASEKEFYRFKQIHDPLEDCISDNKKILNKANMHLQHSDGIYTAIVETLDVIRNFTDDIKWMGLFCTLHPSDACRDEDMD